MNTRARKLPGVFLGFIVTFALLFGFGPNAAAQTVTTENEKWSYATGEAEVTGAAQADAFVHLSYRLSAGIKLTTSEKKSSSCKKIKSGTFNNADTSSKYKCYLLYTGVTFVNSGYRGGKLHYFKDVVGSKWSPGPWQKIVKRSSSYYKAGNSSGKGNCGNIVKMTGSQPSLSYKTVILTRTATDIKYKVDLVVDLNATVTATATATCNTSSASGTASANGSVKATLSIYLMAKTEIEAKAKGKNVKVTVEQVSDFKSKAEIDARLALKAKASAWCKDSPPPVEKPVIVDIIEINDVDVNGTTRFCATVDLPGNETGTLTFAPRFGSLSTRTFSVSGQVEKCTTYTAPTEVPTGGKDTITVTVRSANGQSATDSTTFTINAAPQPPG